MSRVPLTPIISVAEVLVSLALHLPMSGAENNKPQAAPANDVPQVIEIEIGHFGE